MKTHLNSQRGDINTEITFAILMILSIIAALAFAIVWRMDVRKIDELKAQAVQSGCAYWEVDQATGNTEFKWATPEERAER